MYVKTCVPRLKVRDRCSGGVMREGGAVSVVARNGFV
jgi:hypothetical protein